MADDTETSTTPDPLTRSAELVGSALGSATKTVVDAAGSAASAATKVAQGATTTAMSAAETVSRAAGSVGATASDATAAVVESAAVQQRAVRRTVRPFVGRRRTGGVHPEDVDRG